ncbi:MAG: HAD family phosphatase [Oscillospiraceae bacterium]|nr:HAD family phosphatase [Oscillospiraceae bacterium]
MIRNILFDMGSVLVDFNPLRFTVEAKLSPEDAQLIREELFHSIEWAQLDRGTLTDPELLEIMKPRFPERLWPSLEWMICRWDEPPVMVPGMYELVEELSRAGYGLYLLSNAALRHDEYWPRYPVSRFFGDRLLISSHEKITKPDPRFYRLALERFGLDPAECVFIDDVPVNAEGAVYCGIGAIVFRDARRLRRELQARGVRLS